MRTISLILQDSLAFAGQYSYGRRFRCVPIAHAQFTCKRILLLFAYDGCIQGAFQILVNPTSGGSQLLGGILTNLYLSVSSVTVP